MEGLTPGTRVAVNPSHPCGRCLYCRRGMRNECLDMHFIGSAMRMPHDQGGFRQSLTVRRNRPYPSPTALTLGEAAMAEPLAVCLHAARMAGSLIGQRVLITGAGPIGNLLVVAAKLGGAREIVVTDLNPFALGIARHCGATTTLNLSADPEALAPYARTRARSTCTSKPPAASTHYAARSLSSGPAAQSSSSDSAETLLCRSTQSSRRNLGFSARSASTRNSPSRWR